MDLTLLFCFPKNWCKSVIVSLFKYLFGFVYKILWLRCLLWGKTGSMSTDYEALVKYFPWLLFTLYIFYEIFVQPRSSTQLFHTVCHLNIHSICSSFPLLYPVQSNHSIWSLVLELIRINSSFCLFLFLRHCLYSSGWPQ